MEHAGACAICVKIKRVSVLHHNVVWLDSIDLWLNPNNRLIQSVHTLHYLRCVIGLEAAMTTAAGYSNSK